MLQRGYATILKKQLKCISQCHNKKPVFCASLVELAFKLHKKFIKYICFYFSDAKLTLLKPAELLELSSFAAAVGLWDLVPFFSIHRGHPHFMLSALKSRSGICRGAIDCLLGQICLVPLLLEENGQWLFDYIIENCHKFDTTVLKVLQHKHMQNNIFFLKILQDLI